MPKYIVISNHPPESCPSANATIRDRNKNMEKDLAPFLQKYKVKPDLMYHLDPGHKVLWVLEAPNAEAVRDLIYASGLSQWNDFQFFMASTLPEVTSWTDSLKPVW